MTTDETLDNYYRALQDQAGALRRAFVAALARLEVLSDDFGPGSQQRFMQYMRACADLRDQRWEVQQRIEKIGEPPDDGPPTNLEFRREELFKDATDDGCG